MRLGTKWRLEQRSSQSVNSRELGNQETRRRRHRGHSPTTGEDFVPGEGGLPLEGGCLADQDREGGSPHPPITSAIPPWPYKAWKASNYLDLKPPPPQMVLTCV